jgi:hypothetical protein
MNSRAIEVLKRVNGTREAAIVSLGIFMVDTLAHNAAVLQTGAGIGERALGTVPSAFVASELSDDILGESERQFDVAIDVGSISTAIILARQTTGIKETAAIALSAQILSSVADGAAAEGNMLSKAEMSQQDVGSSAITCALLAKYLLDKTTAAENERQHRRWAAATTAFVGSLTVGASLIDRKNGTTDLISHSVGILTGLAASKIGATRRSNNDAAAQNQVTAVEYS